MAIGLCGAHCTGKTTLAQAFEEVDGTPFLRTSVAGVFADMGLNPADTHAFSVRMNVQERILDEFAKIVGTVSGEPFITDRTPIDFMAYTLADIGPTSLQSEEDANRLKRYIDRCFDVSNRSFGALIVVQPGLPVLPREGRGSLSPMYIEHVAHLIRGLASSERTKCPHFYIPSATLSLSERVKCVYAAQRRVLQRSMQHVESIPDNQYAFH